MSEVSFWGRVFPIANIASLPPWRWVTAGLAFAAFFTFGLVQDRKRRFARAAVKQDTERAK
jgi:hypothetical protein